MFNHIIPAPLEPASSPGRSSGTGHPDTQRIIRNCLTEAHLCLHAHHTLDLTAACYIWSPSPASGTLEKCPVLSKPDDRIFMTLSVTKKKKKKKESNASLPLPKQFTSLKGQFEMLVSQRITADKFYIPTFAASWQIYMRCRRNVDTRAGVKSLLMVYITRLEQINCYASSMQPWYEEYTTHSLNPTCQPHLCRILCHPLMSLHTVQGHV